MQSFFFPGTPVQSLTRSALFFFFLGIKFLFVRNAISIFVSDLFDDAFGPNIAIKNISGLFKWYLCRLEIEKKTIIETLEYSKNVDDIGLYSS